MVGIKCVQCCLTLLGETDKVGYIGAQLCFDKFAIYSILREEPIIISVEGGSQFSVN